MQQVTRVDGPAYARGARLATTGAPVAGTLPRLLFSLRHLPLVPSYLQLLTALPVQVLPVSAGPAGEALRRHLTGSWRRSGSHAHLALPDTMDEYLRGRSRQALRTNLHRAEALGLSCAMGVASEREEALEVYLRECVAERRPETQEQVTALFTHWWTVRDAAGRAQGHAFVLADRRTALLQLLMGSEDLELAHQTRYLLHAAVVRDLIASGRRHLVLEALLGAPEGHKYFAARLGYRACRVKAVVSGPAHPLTTAPAARPAGVLSSRELQAAANAATLAAIEAVSRVS